MVQLTGFRLECSQYVYYFYCKKSHKVDKTTDVCEDSVLIKHALSFPLYIIEVRQVTVVINSGVTCIMP